MTIFNPLQMQQKGYNYYVYEIVCSNVISSVFRLICLFILDRLGSFSQTLHLQALGSFQKLRQLILKSIVYHCLTFVHKLRLCIPVRR